MARPEYLSVRLIVWEGVLRDPRTQVKAYISQLKDNIDESLQETQWRYSRWKTYPADDTGKHKLEVYIRHAGVLEDHAKTKALHELSGKLLRSDLAARLRLENPAVPFTFCPSKEGAVSVVDNLFACCFSVAVVTQYCVDGTQSEEMERLKGDSMNRNQTKYLHMPQVFSREAMPCLVLCANFVCSMVALYNLASIAELYERHIFQMLDQIEQANGIVGGAGTFSKLRQTVEKHTAGLGGTAGKAYSQLIKIPSPSGASAASYGMNENGGQSPEQMLRLAIALAVSISRAFVGYSPEIKKQLKPMLEILNNVAIKGRLTLASQAYVSTSKAPITALDHLAGRENATPDQIATTINSFGSLMQSTLPLFDATLAISDTEFASIFGLSIAGGVGLAGLGSGGIWLWCAGATAGPVGLLLAGGATAAAFGAAAVFEGVKWGKRQRLEPSNVLLSIQKSVEECCRFLLGLAFMLAEEEEKEGRKQDPAYLAKIQTLRHQLRNEDFAKPGYMRGYYRLVSDKLKQEMVTLAEGLRARGVEVVVADG